MSDGIPRTPVRRSPPRPSARDTTAFLWPAALVAAALTLVVYAVDHGDGGWLVDLTIYRDAGADVLRGEPVYTDVRPFFTNPPFAAAVFAPLAAVPMAVAWPMWTFLSLLCLQLAVRFTLAWVAPDAPAAVPRWLPPLAAVAGMWLDPVATTLLLGQVNVILLALLTFDLSREDGHRFKGAGVGVLTGVKLFPGILVVYLLLTRRFRAAATAVCAFAATVAVGFAVLPAESVRYWGGLFLDSHRIATAQDIYSESIRSVLTRWAHDAAAVVVPTWVAAVLVGLVALWLAHRLHRLGEDFLGAGVCVVAALLVTPISWNHYWTFVIVPLLVLLGWRAYRARSAPSAVAAALLAAHSYANPEKWGVVRDHAGNLRLGTGDLLLTSTYLLLAVGLLVAAGVVVARRRVEQGAVDRRLG